MILFLVTFSNLVLVITKLVCHQTWYHRIVCDINFLKMLTLYLFVSNLASNRNIRIRKCNLILFYHLKKLLYQLHNTILQFIQHSNFYFFILLIKIIFLLIKIIFLHNKIIYPKIIIIYHTTYYLFYFSHS